MSNISIYAIATILAIHTIINCLTSTVGQYVYRYYLEIYPNSSNYTVTNAYHAFYVVDVNTNETSTCSHKNISRDGDAQTWAQQSSAELFFWTSLVSSCPVIIMTYVLGLYTPQLGKRVVLLIPMLGSTIQLILWLLIIYFRLSELWWYTAAFINGLSGAGGVISLTLTLIITENTPENERSSRFVRFGAMQTAIAAIATLTIGYYISWRGFNDLYWMALTLQILAIVIVLRFLKGLDNHVDERTHLLSSSSSNDEVTVVEPVNWRNFFKVFTVLHSNQRSKKKRISLFLTLFANGFFTLGSACFAPLLFYLLNAPFCWTSKDIGKFSALNALTSAFLSLLGMNILTYFGVIDVTICAISHVFFFASALLVAFARYDWQLFLSLLLNAFSGYQGTLTTSMMSKWLSSYEQNNAFTLVTEINTIITTFGTAFFNWLYAHTVIYQPNLVLLIAAGLSVIPFILNICLFIVTRKMPDDDVLSTDKIESEPFHSENNTLPHADDAAYLIIPSQSLTTTVQTPSSERYQSDPTYDNQTQHIMNPTNNDLGIL
ncbi:unnamed protein product [Rotaria socialis]|uniref:Uncharacterized protein n=1 Tax=Rotaria socialis TaxID=392032 RepID=A0A818P1N6_9BILA|nr:unnamed protein product [Rotaria socialis]CAF4487827.1 unnamed protein product [Rotaria socialis]